MGFWTYLGEFLLFRSLFHKQKKDNPSQKRETLDYPDDRIEEPASNRKHHDDFSALWEDWKKDQDYSYLNSRRDVWDDFDDMDVYDDLDDF